MSIPSPPTPGCFACLVHPSVVALLFTLFLLFFECLTALHLSATLAFAAVSPGVHSVVVVKLSRHIRITTRLSAMLKKSPLAEATGSVNFSVHVVWSLGPLGVCGFIGSVKYSSRSKSAFSRHKTSHKRDIADRATVLQLFAKGEVLRDLKITSELKQSSNLSIASAALM